MIHRKYILDASALLALIQNEEGTQVVDSLLDDSTIHSVNLAEVARKLVQKGMSVVEATELLSDLHLDVIEELSEKQAYHTANWTGRGLSLGDSVCLTTGHVYEHTIVTADRAWSKLENVQREIVQIR